MTIPVYSYTIYHSPNVYLGTVLLRRAIAGLPGVELVRRPIYVPRDLGLIIAELLGGRENRNAGSYNREDCRRWWERFGIPMSYSEPATIAWAVERAALDPERLMTELAEPGPAEEVRSALAEVSSACNAPASQPSSSMARAFSARTGSIGSLKSAAPEGKLPVFIATGYPRPRNRPHNFSSARRDCRAALAMTLQCHCEERSDEAISRPSVIKDWLRKADRKGAGGAISAA